MTKPADSVFCACGAQWHGKYVVRAQSVIAIHAGRGRVHHEQCEPVSHDWFRQRFRCQCAACGVDRAEERAERARQRLLKTKAS